jgi:hypothetical protein
MNSIINHSKKISLLMNRLYEKKNKFIPKKNKLFVEWQYFNKNFKTKLSVSKLNNQIVSMAGLFKKETYNKDIVYQLIGLGTLSEYRSKGYFKKNLKKIIDKKYKMICFANYDAHKNKLLRKYLPQLIKIENYLISKKHLDEIEIKKEFIIENKDFFFKKTKIFYKNRYLKHPINKHYNLKKKNYEVFFKKIKIKNKIFIDILDIKSKKKIDMTNILYELKEELKKTKYDFMNIFSLKNSSFSNYLKYMNFNCQTINNKYLIFSRNLSIKKIKNKIIFLGDADY